MTRELRDFLPLHSKVDERPGTIGIRLGVRDVTALELEGLTDRSASKRSVG